MYEVIDEKGIMFLGAHGPEKIKCGSIITEADIKNKKFTENEIRGLLKFKRIKKIETIKKNKKYIIEDKK